MEQEDNGNELPQGSMTHSHSVWHKAGPISIISKIKSINKSSAREA